jgi:hypothetical protein
MRLHVNPYSPFHLVTFKMVITQYSDPLTTIIP